jgi:DNA primase
MVALGLVVATRDGYPIDRFRDRIMFLVCNGDLQPVGFVSRGRGGPAKHLNTSTTRIYRKTATLTDLLSSIGCSRLERYRF